MDDPIPFDPSRCGAEPLPTIFGRILVPHCAVPVVPAPIRETGTNLLTLAPPAGSGAMGPPGPPGAAAVCIWQGLVVGGTGNVWQVLIYPRGPDCPPQRPPVDVKVLGIPDVSTDDAPAGLWIGPIHGYDGTLPGCSSAGSEGSSTGSSAGSDGGDTAACNPTAYYWTLPPVGNLAFTDPAGIPGRGPVYPGVAAVQIFSFNGVQAHSARRARCFNIYSKAIAGNRWIITSLIDGCHFATGEDC